MRNLILIAAALALTALPAAAQMSSDRVNRPAAVGDFSPNVMPSLTVQRADSDVEIDGWMNDAAWSTATVATGFSETFPGDQTQPPIDIRVHVMYDDEYLYLFYEIEDNPEAIRVHMSDRDAIWSDDYVGMILDPNNDGATQYFIAANPLGIQGDTRISRFGEDVSFDLIYDTAAQMTENGYQVEFAIPFRSLRFPAEEVQTWSATFWITHPRSTRNTYSWAAIDRDNNCFTCQLGTLEGMRGVTSGKNLEVLPSLTATHFGSLTDAGDPRSVFDNQTIAAEPSLNVKYGITSDLTADVTLNPDFSQIESDAAQVDVNSTFALFYPEQRPFFQEGADMFDTFISAVYTRSINDPIVAGKMTGRFGRTAVGYIGGRDNRTAMLLPFEEGSSIVPDVGRSFSNILRVQHNLPGNSFVGGLVTDRRLDDGGSGSVFAADASVRFLQKYTIEAQFAGSHTVEPDDAELSSSLGDATFADGKYTAALDGESFTGWAAYASLARDGRHWSADLDYRATNPAFRADNGFVTQNDVQRLAFYQGYTFYPEGRFVNRFTPWMDATRIWNMRGLRKDQWAGGGFSASLARQTHVNVHGFFSQERFRDIDFDNVKFLNVNVSSNFSDPVRAGFFASIGHRIARNLEVPEVGTAFDAGGNATIRPTQRLVLQPSMQYSRLRNRETGENYFSGYIVRVRTNYQFTRRLFVRVITQYNDFSQRLEVDPLITYKINAFSALYFGSTHDLDTYARLSEPSAEFFRQSNRQLFFKLQYLFRR